MRTAPSSKSPRRCSLGSGFAMLPLFAAAFSPGDQIVPNADPAPEGGRDWPAPFATATAALFIANPAIGVSSLLESRKDLVGQTRRIVHGPFFIEVYAGFTSPGTTLADRAGRDGGERDVRRAVASSSMGVLVASWVSVLFSEQLRKSDR